MQLTQICYSHAALIYIVFQMQFQCYGVLRNVSYETPEMNFSTRVPSIPFSLLLSTVDTMKVLMVWHENIVIIDV